MKSLTAEIEHVRAALKDKEVYEDYCSDLRDLLGVLEGAQEKIRKLELENERLKKGVEPHVKVA